MHAPCPSCGRPHAGRPGFPCDACHLRAGLNPAEELYLRHGGGDGRMPATDFEALCRRFPSLGTELHRIHANAQGPTEAPAPANPAPSSGFGRYERLQTLARGGMGVIYTVRDRELSRRLAMKILVVAGQDPHRPVPFESLPSNAVDRFIEEAQITGQLDHPGIVPVHELGVDEHGRLFFTMKLVEGRNLAEIIEAPGEAHREWTLPRLIGVLVRACQAVAYAHERGVIHRDLKPHNIMVGSLGEVYVMDWGLARVLDRPDLHNLHPSTATESPSTSVPIETIRDSNSPLLTMDGAVLGTPAYIAPEHAGGAPKRMTSRSDVYSLGAVLFHLLTGHAPYADADADTDADAGADPRSLRDLLDALMAGPPSANGERWCSSPLELRAICQKAMAREPQQRYPNARALADDLQAWLDHRVVLAYQRGPVAELRAWVRRNRAFALAAGLGLFAVIAGALLITASNYRERRAFEQRLYATSVREAALKLPAGQTEAARELLAQCPPHLRGWEWKHLRLASLTWTSRPLVRRAPGLRALVVAPTHGAFVTASGDEPLALRSLTDGSALRQFGPTNATHLACSADGRRLLAAEPSGRLTLWELPSGQCLARWTNEGTVGCLAVSSNGTLAATASTEGVLRVWLPRDAHPSRSVTHHPPISAIAFLHHESHLLFGDATGGVWEWNLADDAPVRQVGRQASAVFSLAVSPDGRHLATGSDRGSGRLGTGLILWDLEEGWSHDLQVPNTFSGIHSLQFDSTGDHLLACGYFGSLLLADVTTGRLDASLAAGTRSAARASLVSDNTSFLSWDSGGEVIRFTRILEDHFRLNGPAGQLRTLAQGPNHRLLYAASARGEVHEWDLDNRTLRRRLPIGPTFVTALHLAKAGDWFITGSNDGYLRRFSTDSGSIVWTSPSDPGTAPRSQVWWLDVDSDERLLVAGYANGTLCALDPVSGDPTSAPIQAHPGPVEGVRFSPDNHVLASCGHDGSVALWQVAPWKARWRVTDQLYHCRSVAFSPDGRWLAHGNGDGATHLRHVEDGRLEHRLAGHDGRVLATAFSPDGSRLLTSAEDGTVRVWNPGNGMHLATLTATTRSPVWEVAFSADGRQVLAADGEGKITVWIAEEP